MRKIDLKIWIERFNQLHNTEEYRKEHGHDYYDYSSIIEINGCDSKIEVRCIKHDNIFKVSPKHHYTNNSGCLKCVKLQPLTNEIIDQRIKEQNRELIIKRIGDVLNSGTKILWKCLNEDCDYEWLNTPNSIIIQKHNCPKCYGNTPLTNELMDFRLGKRKIKRIDDVINAVTPIAWQCTKKKCGYIWKTSPNSIFHSKSNCPKCSDNAPLTNEEVDRRIKLQGREYLIERIGDVVGGSSKIRWRCKSINCKHEWMANPSVVTGKNRTGCPHCNLSQGALEVANILRSITQFKYDLEYWFDDFVNPWTNEHLRFDFVIYNTRNEILFLIEYQGEQHYFPMRYSYYDKVIRSKKQGEEILQSQQYRDQLKRDYCKKEGIPLIEIPYWEYDKGNLENYLMKEIERIQNENRI